LRQAVHIMSDGEPSPPATSSKGLPSQGISEDKDVPRVSSPIDVKLSAQELIKRYFVQLTEGCGRAECSNEHCATGNKTPLSRNEAAATALKLLGKKAKICETKYELEHSSENVVNVAVAPDPILSKAYIEETINTCKETGDFKALVRVLGKTFSSPEILNRSFSVDSSEMVDFSSPQSILRLDHEEIVDTYQLLFELDQEVVENSIINAFNALGNSIEIDMKQRESNQRETTDIDLHQFVIVMLNPNLHSPEYLESALPNILRAMTSLPMKLQGTLVKYWSKFPASELRKLLDVFQQMITVRILTGPHTTTGLSVNDDQPVTNSVRCMEMVYFASLLGGGHHEAPSYLDEPTTSGNSVTTEEKDTDMPLVPVQSREEFIRNTLDPLNEREPDHVNTFNSKLFTELARDIPKLEKHKSPLIPYTDFVNECLNDAIEMDRDFMNFKDDGIRFSFLRYSFVLSTMTKHLGLFYDNRVRMYSERRMSILYALMGQSPSPYLKLKVRRDHLIQDALVRLELVVQDSPGDFRKQFFVEFEGEQGVDEGGVSKEFFQLVIEELFNPNFGMFKFDEDTRHCWFIPSSFENAKEFALIGLLFGIAIYNNIILDVHFPPVVYRKLLGKTGTLEDLKDSHPTIYRGLKYILEYEGDIESDIGTNFEVSYVDVFGDTVNHELVAGGKEKFVNQDNKLEYVDRYADFLLNKSIKRQFEAFKSGFDIVVKDSILKSLIRPDELELLVCGSQTFDMHELEQATDYDAGYTKDSQVIKYFWEVVHEMSIEEQRRLLKFTTGSDRVPVGGLAKLKLIIAKNGDNSERLPTSHTCFNVLLLPEYDSVELTRDRLMKAISYAQGFGLM